ncbi:sulfatase-like hydrolase/transferase [Streptomyces sp. Ag109_G2-15]|uniref:sulfatase-like hydrolase/transferase n=1 Tax=Streptomyces sp. Ag109_G2-15 TaxID=1938850 RepID=UPI000BD174E7|nr:Phosphoglycerol transferase MdoB [Streptomyces sp. Ag109_G2-15]
MPQHTSTRQSSGTAGGAEAVLDERDEERTPAAEAAGSTEATEVSSEEAAPAAGVADSIAEEAPAETVEKPAAESLEEPAEEPTAETPEKAPEEPAAGTADEAPEEPAEKAAEQAAEQAAEAATPRPTRRTWSAWSARTRRWREAHPTAAQALSVSVNVLAAVLVVAALVMPNSVVRLGPEKFLRIPGEAVIGAAVMLALPRRPRIVLAAVSGVALGAMTVLNLLDMGFNQYLGRSFNLVLDWSLLGDAESYLEDSLGRTATLAAAGGVIAVVLLLFVLLALSTVRLSNLLARHTGTATRGTLIAGVVWITCSSLGLQISGVPLASDRTATAVKIQARRVADTLRDEAEFQKVAKVDAFGNTPAAQLVPDLRGKDMIFTFIESYGRSAIEDPIMAPGVDSTLDARTKALAKAGYHAKSGWLTSATYGGSSWLGHSTTLSGLWINNQQRYRTVMASDHLSLTKAFKKTGAWDTVGVMPGVQKAWPEQSFYGLDKVYNAFELGYKGPKFSWSTMPDQYALEQFQQRVHGRKHDKPMMSELILTSSHQPWAPIPKMVGWDQLGDGSIFKGIQAAGNKPADVIADTTKSRQEYGKSIQYSVTALTEWLERYGTDDTVLVFLGDHQPIARVSGNHASRDVPISIVAKDPKVLDKITDWGWTDGLRPAHEAPVWKMSAFRDKFLTAYGSTPHPKKG